MKKTFTINGQDIAVEDLAIQHGEVRFSLNGKDYHFTAHDEGQGHFTLKQNGRNRRGFVAGKTAKGTQPMFLHGGLEVTIEQQGLERKRGQAGAKGTAHTAPMPGTIQKVLVKAGDAVEAGDVLVVMEAMKLQLNIEAAYAGTVKEVCCEAGGLVSDGTLLVDVQSKDEKAA